MKDLKVKPGSKLTYAYVVAIIAMVGIGGAYLRYSPNSQKTSAPQISSTNASENQKVSIPQNSSLTATSGIATNSLHTILAINSSQITSGQAINVSVYDVNALNANLTVNSALNASAPGGALYQYPAEGMMLAPCPDAIMPAIYSGYYTSQNISQAKALQIFPPYGASCPIEGHFMKSVTFAPESDSILLGGSFSSYVSTNTFTGYYIQGTNNCLQDNNTVTASCPYIVSFPQGTYTVIAGDQWGGLAILYLKVN